MSQQFSDLSDAERCRIDDLCGEFQSLLLSAESPRIEEFLERSDHPKLLYPKLLRLELSGLRNRGQTLASKEYLTRFPQLQSATVTVFGEFDQTGVSRSPLSEDENSTQAPETIAEKSTTSTSLNAQTRRDFEAFWRSAGIHSDAEISAYLEELPAKLSEASGLELAKYAIRRKWLTQYQGREILRGRVKTLVLGNYTIHDRLGKGGMGQVFLATHLRMGRQVALKVLTQRGLRKSESVQRFYKEILASARLSHPNIVTAFDADEVESLHFLVMEYVPGQDLRGLVRNSGPLPVSMALDYLLQAARGLEYAHQNGVLHRDIKPANLLLSTDGVVKVLDMGLAQFIDEQGTGRKLGDLTQSGQILGTPDYMSPEQAREAKDIDARTDVYSLGCTLYFLLTGQPPYPAENLLAQLLAHRECPIPALTSVRPEVCESLDSLFQEMLAKDPDERISTMAEVVRRLTEIQNELASQTGLTADTPVTDPARPAPEQGDVPHTRLVPQIDTSISLTETTSPSNKRSGIKWTVIAASMVFLIILTVSVIKLMQPPTGRLVLQVSEQDSTLILSNAAGEALLGPVNAMDAKELDVPVGRYQLLVSKPGFQDSTTWIEPRGGALLRVQVELQKLTPDPPPVVTGTLTLSTDTPGVEIQIMSLGDKSVVRTIQAGPKSEDTELPAGQYRISVQKSGFTDYSTDLQITADAVLRHEIRLEKTTDVALRTENAEQPVTRQTPDTDSPAMVTTPPNPEPTSSGTDAPAQPPKMTPPDAAPPVWSGWPAGTPQPLIAPFTREDAMKAQREWAKHLGFGSKRDNYFFTNRFNMVFVLIPPGEFTMGAPMEEVQRIAARGGWKLDDRDFVAQPRRFGPQRRVIISKPFFLSVAELTEEQRIRMNAFRNNQTPEPPPNPPAEFHLQNPFATHGFGVVEFVRNLGMVEGFTGRYLVQRDQMRVTIAEPDKATYRLPTMAEWEYAARAGTTGAHWMLELEPTDRRSGITSPEQKLLASEAIYENSKSGQQQVGKGLPNPFGLYDIIGNRRELCEDGETQNYFDRDDPEPWVDPVVPLHRWLSIKGSMYDTEQAMIHVSRYAFQDLNHSVGCSVRLVLDVEAALQLRNR